MSISSDFYKETDKTITRLNRLAIRRFRDAQMNCGAWLIPFDELTVIREVRQLYSGLDAENRKAFLELARTVYRRTKPHGNAEPDSSWLYALLDEYSPITKYRYTTEVDRKRDYTTEAVIASADKGKEFKRGLLYWGKLVSAYGDIVTDAATIKAFKDSGVEKVRWVSEHDNRVCDTCEDRDGKVYPIDKVPAKSHIGCRCHLEAVN